MKTSELIALLQKEIVANGNHDIYMHYCMDEIRDVETVTDEDGFTWTNILD